MADTGRDPQLDAIVNEVVSEAHISRSLLLPEEIQYIREHALNNPRKTAPVWIPRNGKGAAGISSVMVTCPGCLKSFPLDVKKESDFTRRLYGLDRDQTAGYGRKRAR